jgi:hypothetical protein
LSACTTDFTIVELVRVPRFSSAMRRSGRKDSSAVVSTILRQAAATASPISSATRRMAASMEMPDSTQISIRSSASGHARLIECWRLPIRLEMKIFGA